MTAVSYLGHTFDTDDAANAEAACRLAAHNMTRGPQDASDHLLTARRNLLNCFANFLTVKQEVALRRASFIVGDMHAPSNGAKLLASAVIVLGGFEHDLKTIELMLRAAERTVESFDGTTYVAETVSNYHELLQRMRQQAQERISLIDVGLIQDIMTQYAALNIVP